MYSNYKNDDDDFEVQSEPYLEWNEDVWGKDKILQKVVLKKLC